MKSIGFYGRLEVKKAPVSAVGSAGGVLLTRTVDVSGALREALGGWRKPLAVHDPAKVLTDLGVTVALGGDCLADTALLRGEPGLYGPVGSHATMSRTVGVFARDADTVLAAVAAAWAPVWSLAGRDAPDHGLSADKPLIVDLNATLLTSHSEKENAAPTFKKGFGFHPMCAFIDHGKQGSGEVLAIQLPKGNAGSNTVADQRRWVPADRVRDHHVQRPRPAPTWSCVTADAAGARTGSRSPRTPACGTCLYKGSTRTGSGAPS